MTLLLRHFGVASGRIGAIEFGALGVLPLALLVVLASALLSGAPTTWVAWALGLAAVAPLWVLAVKRLADLGFDRWPAHVVALLYGLHLGLAGAALSGGQSAAQWLFLLPAPGAIPAEGALQWIWIATGVVLLGSLCVLSAIPGEDRDNAFGADPRARLTAAADEQEDSALEGLAARLLAAPSRAFAITGRLTVVAVPILMLAAGLLRYDAVEGQLTTVLQSSAIGGVSIVEGMLRGGLVAILFAPPILLVAAIVLPVLAGAVLWLLLRWRVYGRAEALAFNDAGRGPGPDSPDRPAV